MARFDVVLVLNLLLVLKINHISFWSIIYDAYFY